MDAEAKKRRKHTSVEERRELLLAWKTSGLSAARFAEQSGINASNLWRWRSEFQSETDPSERLPQFVELKVDRSVEAAVDAFSQKPPVLQIEIESTSGLHTRVYQGADVEVVRVLLQTMMGHKRC